MPGNAAILLDVEKAKGLVERLGSQWQGIVEPARVGQAGIGSLHFNRDSDMSSSNRGILAFLVVKKGLVNDGVGVQRRWQVSGTSASHSEASHAGGIKPSTHEDGRVTLRQAVDDGLVQKRVKLFDILFFWPQPQRLFDGQRGETLNA